MLNVVKKDRAR